MYFRTLLLFAILISAVSITVQGQQQLGQATEKLSEDFYLKGLTTHVREMLVYPKDALAKSITGTVFVKFEIDSTGTMIKKSVRVIEGLFPSCDLEALRVIKTYQKKLDIPPASGASRKWYVIPVVFTTNDTDVMVDFPSHQLPVPIKTIVKPKPVKADNPAWAVYSKKGMTNVIGRVSPGDTVSVKGWAAWSYFIKGENVTGYVSRNSLEVNSQLDSLANIVNNKSEEEEALENAEKSKEKAQELNVHISDTIYNFSTETAQLSLTSSKNEIYEGECTTITFALNVKASNMLRLQFFELRQQLTRILGHDLNGPGSLVVDHHKANIEGRWQQMGYFSYTTYNIHQASFCPTTATTLQFSPVKLQMVLKRDVSSQTDKLAEFKSNPLVVKVKRVPPGVVISQHDNFKMVGKFGLEEHVSDTIVTTGKPFTYQLTVKGEGAVFPIRPPKLVHPGMVVQLQNIADSDTIVDEVLLSSKTFTYNIMMTQAGTYDFSKMITFDVFNPSTSRKETIHSALQLEVTEGTVRDPFVENGNFNTRINFIAFDASQSMEIEDYHPNRIGAVKQGLKKFYLSNGKCDVGLIVFGGNAKHINATRDSLCYTPDQIDEISSLYLRRGTAIGDAIWLASISRKEGNAPGKLVIIGDGDNTAGTLRPYQAAEIAKKNNLKVYTIGIGHKGPVAYGRDFFGRPNMIDDTFSDRDFKAISKMTGGTYYWAKDANEVNRILNLIFN